MLIHRVELKHLKKHITNLKIDIVANPPCGVETFLLPILVYHLPCVANPPCGVETLLFLLPVLLFLLLLIHRVELKRSRTYKPTYRVKLLLIHRVELKPPPFPTPLHMICICGLLCLISLALALRLLKDNISTSMIYIIKILQMTEISTFPASILDKATEMI